MFDLIIKNAAVFSGNDEPPIKRDVAIKGGRFAAIEAEIQGRARKTIDGNNKALAPGFIDMHAHTDAWHLVEPYGEIRVRQGVCLDVVGNCGLSLAPLKENVFQYALEQFGNVSMPYFGDTFSDYIGALKKTGPVGGVASHVGHIALRVNAMGFDAGPPTDDQLEIMKRQLAESLDQGAVGLSTGLYYPPSGFTDEKELVELCRVVASKGKFHASHIRNEAENIFDALNEIINAARISGAAAHVSHLKAAGRNNWHLADRIIEVFEEAREQGLDLTCDVYPYHHSSTGLLALIPPWAQDGGMPALQTRMKNPADREKIIGQMRDGLQDWENIYHNAGFDGIMLSTVVSPANKGLEGKTIETAASEAGADPFEFVLDLLAEENGLVNIIAASMAEENTARFIALPYAMIGSDGLPREGKPHPRLYGTFPRVIRRFVRELGVLTMQQAIHKMTGLPAARLGLSDAGLIKNGYRADLVLFDPETFADTATFDDPRQYPVGLSHTIIGGRLIIEGGEFVAN